MEDPGKDFRSASGLPIVPAFDGFRAFAIMSVVALHLLTIEQYAADGNESIQAILVWGFLGRAVGRDHDVQSNDQGEIQGEMQKVGGVGGKRNYVNFTVTDEDPVCGCFRLEPGRKHI